MDIEQDFNLRCCILDKYVQKILEFDTSDRVRIAALIENIKKICNRQEDPKGALDQFIEVLKHENDYQKMLEEI